MKKFSKKTIVAFIAAALLSVGAIGGVAVAANNQGNTRPGWGYGDKNHTHTGPPGHSVRP